MNFETFASSVWTQFLTNTVNSLLGAQKRKEHTFNKRGVSAVLLDEEFLMSHIYSIILKFCLLYTYISMTTKILKKIHNLYTPAVIVVVHKLIMKWSNLHDL